MWGDESKALYIEVVLVIAVPWTLDRSGTCIENVVEILINLIRVFVCGGGQQKWTNYLAIEQVTEGQYSELRTSYTNFV